VESILKKSILALCALTLAAGLSACGGGSSAYTIGGTVTGLQYGPLVLVTNGMEVAIEPQAGATSSSVVNYSFPKQLEYGEAYDVTLKTTTDASGTLVFQQPPHQVCSASTVPGTRTADTAGRLANINAAFVCSLASHTIGGTVTGLAADNLVLTNGSTGGTVALAKDATTGAYPTTFLFSTPVTYKQTYGVTVLTQPTGQTCTVNNGVGEMGDVAVTTIEVACVNNPA
jgi:hypothetical protein